MNFFGIGTQELLIIAVVALIVFGPNKLPEVAGQAARWIRDFRKMTADLSGELERNAGVREFKEAIETEIQGVKSQVNQATAAVNREVAGVKSTAKAATTGSTSNAIKGTAAKPVAKPKPSTSTVKAASTTSKATTTPKKPVPTKAAPEVNISLLEEVTPKTSRAAANGVVSQPSLAQPLANGASNGSANGAAADQVAVVPSDALARARERRLSAGYNRRLSS